MHEHEHERREAERAVSNPQARGAPAQADPILLLQRTAGNAAVTRLLNEEVTEPPRPVRSGRKPFLPATHANMDRAGRMDLGTGVEATSAGRLTGGVTSTGPRPVDRPILQHSLGLTGRQTLAGGAGLVTVARRAKPRKASPKPETGYDITGFYHTPSYSTTLQVNSAGNYIVGWMQVRRSGKRFHTSRLEGKLTYSPSLTLEGTYTRAEGALSVSGTIRGNPTLDGYELQLDEQGWRGKLERETSRARLPESAVANMPANVRELVRAGEEMALTPPDRRFLDKQLREIQLLVESYSTIDVTDRIGRRQRASQIDQKAANSLDRFADRVVPAVHTYIRNSLAALPNIKMRSAFDWLTVMATEYPNFTPHYERVFGVKRFKAPEAGGQQHRYRIRTNQGGGGFLGVGATGGSIEVEKLAPDKWKRTYHFAALSLGVGASVSAKGATGGGTVGTWAEFTRGIPYGPDDFYGPFTMTAGSVKMIGVEIADSYINFEGDGSLPVLTVPSGGPVSAGFAGVGIELSRATGRIFGSRKEAIRWAKARRTIASAVVVEATGTSFGVDDAELTAEGRQNVRRFCALNRALLESPRTQVKVLGYTSTTASTEHNQKLSDLRAANTVQAIHDLLGGDLKAKVSAKGLGEGPARKEDPDETENPRWRKVELVVNGQVTTTLWY